MPSGLSSVLADRPDGQARVIELIRLLEAHRSAGSDLAGRLLDEADLASRFWLVEPIVVEAPATVAAGPEPVAGLVSAPGSSAASAETARL